MITGLVPSGVIERRICSMPLSLAGRCLASSCVSSLPTYLSVSKYPLFITSHWIRAHPNMASIYFGYSVESISKYVWNTLRYWGLGHQHIFWRENLLYNRALIAVSELWMFLRLLAHSRVVSAHILDQCVHSRVVSARRQLLTNLGYTASSL